MSPITVSFRELSYGMSWGLLGQSLTDLWNQFNGECIKDDVLVDRFQKSASTAIVAIDIAQAETALGFICFSRLNSPLSCADSIEIWALFVSPQARMRGIGTALVKQVEKQVSESSSMRLFVSADEGQTSFYQKCGYKRSGAVRMIY